VSVVAGKLGGGEVRVVGGVGESIFVLLLSLDSSYLFLHGRIFPHRQGGLFDSTVRLAVRFKQGGLIPLVPIEYTRSSRPLKGLTISALLEETFPSKPAY
jgi:hypothetical protein